MISEYSRELVELLIERKLTITTAESCTGGMISSSIVDIPGASWVLNEAHVTYANEAKMKYLGVKKDTLENYGAVSYETAWEMADGAAKQSGAQCAIAVTGVAGPDGGTKDKPVGTVFAGFYVGGNICVKEYHFSGDRKTVREKTTEEVIKEVIKLIKKYS